MFIRLLDNKTMNWRVRKADRIAKRIYWKLKNRFDTSKKERVKGISMIVVGRNDNYGGDFTERLRTTIDWNYNNIENVELIYVEWNKIADKPTDTDWISERYPNSKCYIVPTSIHNKIAANPKMPVMEYYAKNLGIRQASNEWVMMINADVFLDPKVTSQFKNLSKNHIYGTHYKNIIWHGEPLTNEHIADESKIKNLFSTNSSLHAAVGNFILTHKDNWLKATGYDETLNDVRLGVDSNGLRQLLYMGLKTMVLGDHFHLDHAESAINAKNATHGNALRIQQGLNIPYKNPDDWGFVNYPKKEIANNIWELQEI